MNSEKKLQEKFEQVPCDFCGENGFKVKFYSPVNFSRPIEQTDFMASIDRFDRYGQIVQCVQCGLVYANPRIKQEIILEGYRNSVDVSYQKEDAGRSMNAYLSLNTIKRFIQSGKLLDIGCATGYFLNAARLDFETAGIEPCVWASQYAKEKLKLNVMTSTLTESSFPDQYFDAVTLIDVIEHLHNPCETIGKISAITKSGGFIYIVTPDICSLSARLLGQKWWGLRPAHLYYFSVHTLSRMLEKCGYQVCFTRSFGKIFTLSFWAARLRNYPRFVFHAANGFINALGVQEKLFYINTRDSMEIMAQKIGDGVKIIPSPVFGSQEPTCSWQAGDGITR